MQISRLIWEAFQDLLAADTTTLADTDAMKVYLVVANFIPSLDLNDIADLVLASFTGSAAKAAGVGAQQTFYDPISGLRYIQVLEPAGGWTWECTVTPGAPQTVYGFVLTNNAGDTIYGSQLLETPVMISAAGQAVTIPQVRMGFLSGSPV
jgi:hypothetical protein